MNQPQLKHFTLEEFACPCCGQIKMAGELLEMLDKARDISCTSYEVTSGFRCTRHNAAVGGSATSSHLHGFATDIKVMTDRQREALLKGMINAGFRRIGIGRTFIHMDIDPAKQGAVWLYG